MTLTSRHNGTSRSELRSGAAEGLRRLAADLLARSSVQVIESASSVSVDPGEIEAVEVSAGQLIAEPQEPHDDRSEEVEDSGVALASVEGAAVTFALVLCDHLPDQTSAFSWPLGGGSSMAGMVSYTWYSEENFNKAHRWCLGLISASQGGMPVQFFVDAIVDLYHFDRSFRASAHSRGKKRPVRRTDIPQHLPRNSSYQLATRPFAWSPTVPDHAVDSVSEFLQEITPDKLWIAEYQWTPQVKNDPIIYATFGPWEIEVAQWD